MFRPGQIFTDGTHLFVTDVTNGRVLIFNSIPASFNDPADVTLGQCDVNTGSDENEGRTVSATSLGSPFGVYYDGTRLIIGDSLNNRVLIYNSLPTSSNTPANVVIGQSAFTTNTSGTTASKLNGPRGIYSNGTMLLIADSGNNRVLVYNSIPVTNNAPANIVLGQPNFTTKASGSGTSKMDQPTGVFGDRGFQFFISDTANDRVLIYGSMPVTSGAPADLAVGQADLIGALPNQGLSAPTSQTLSGPGEICVAGGNLFVLDGGNDRVLIYNGVPTADDAGASLVVGQPDFVSFSAYEGGAIGPVGFSGPSGMSSDGIHLFVSEFANNRLLAYNSIPSANGGTADLVEGQADFFSNDFNRDGGTSANHLIVPAGTYYDGTNLYETDSLHNRVLVYNSIPSANNAAA